MTAPAYVVAPVQRSTLAQQLDYNIECNAAMHALGARVNLDPRRPLYSHDELAEMEFARVNGFSAATFVTMLVARDKKAGAR